MASIATRNEMVPTANGAHAKVVPKQGVYSALHRKHGACQQRQSDPPWS
ncbi:hypothetical protein NKI32_06455 [Mesorhizobium sp. M0761]